MNRHPGGGTHGSSIDKTNLARVNGVCDAVSLKLKPVGGVLLGPVADIGGGSRQDEEGISAAPLNSSSKKEDEVERATRTTLQKVVRALNAYGGLTPGP